MSKHIFLIVGKSGVGKTSIVSALCRKCGLKSVYSYTTRPKRNDDEKGHIFVSDADFDKIKYDLCAYTEFNGYRYGATNRQINNCDLYVIDYDGVKYFKEHYTGSKQPLVILITANERTCKNRMLKRGDSEEAAEARVVNDRVAFAQIDKIADVAFENYSFTDCVNAIGTFIKHVNAGDYFKDNNAEEEN
ncbi:MAG TPA: hypothetical protein PLT28_00290 [Saprospiraceae bacterium]|nr:hypothetical protein [Saprospiraceae bacterium]